MAHVYIFTGCECTECKQIVSISHALRRVYAMLECLLRFFLNTVLSFLFSLSFLVSFTCFWFCLGSCIFFAFEFFSSNNQVFKKLIANFGHSEISRWPKYLSCLWSWCGFIRSSLCNNYLCVLRVVVSHVEEEWGKEDSRMIDSPWECFWLWGDHPHRRAPR